MQTKFKDIAQYYLGTGLEIVDTPSNTNGYLNGINPDEIYFQDGWYSSNRFKPLLRSLDSLTKPITVKGYNDDKEFVPIEELLKTRYCDVEFDFIEAIEDDWASADTKMEFAPFSIFKKLLSWHFNIFGLEETEYIKID